MPRIKVEFTVYDTRLHIPSNMRSKFFYMLSMSIRNAIEKYTQFNGNVILDITYKLSQVDDDDMTLEVHNED